MSVTVVDLTQDATVAETQDGFTATRQFLVSDLGGKPETRVARALRANKIPRVLEFHPAFLGGVQVDNVTAKLVPGNVDRVKVTAKYQILDDGDSGGGVESSETVGAVVTSAVTNLNTAGDQIVLLHQRVSATGVNVGDPIEQGGEVTINIPSPSVRFTRREDRSPLANALEFVGKVNEVSFKGKPERTWLCTRIQGTRIPRTTLQYKVDYEFQFRVNTWDATVVFIDPETGKPPPNVVEGADLQTHEVYETINFGRLNLG